MRRCMHCDSDLLHGTLIVTCTETTAQQSEAGTESLALSVCHICHIQMVMCHTSVGIAC